MKRPDNFEELLKTASNFPDMLGAMSRLGYELKHVGRTRNGGERYQTKVESGTAGDLSSVAFIRNTDGSWVVIDNKQRTGKLSMSAIDAVRAFGGVSFDDAVYMLSGGTPFNIAQSNSQAQQATRQLSKVEEPVVFVPPQVAENKRKNVYAYLTQARELPPTLVTSLLDSGKIYPSISKTGNGKEQAMCSFRIMDENGTVVGVDSCAANSNIKFKKITSGSNSDYAWCFNWKIDNITPQTHMYVCEAPIDAISLCALSDMPGIYVSLGGVKPKTFEHMVELLKSTPIICTDNDEAGNNFAKRYPQYSRLTPSKGKDWNDELKACNIEGISYAMSSDRTPKKAESVPKQGTLEGATMSDTAMQDNAITPERIQQLRGIGRKSVNTFTAEDLQIAKPWQERLDAELGIKSPFFRARFGDWRAYDTNSILITDIPQNLNINSSNRFVKNLDTSWNIQITSDAIGDTLHYANKDKIYLERMLSQIDTIIERSILLDTAVSEKNSTNKKGSSQLMHYFYGIVEFNGAPFLSKVTIEEYEIDGKRRAYNLQRIKMSTLSRAQYSQIKSAYRGIYASNADSISISELYAFVKAYDIKFSPREIKDTTRLNPNGTPKEIYVQKMLHGSILKDEAVILPKEDTMAETKIKFNWKKGWDVVDTALGGYAETSYEWFDPISEVKLLKSKVADVWHIGTLGDKESPKETHLIYSEAEAKAAFEEIKEFNQVQLATKPSFSSMSASEIEAWIEKYGTNRYVGDNVYLFNAQKALEEQTFFENAVANGAPSSYTVTAEDVFPSKDKTKEIEINATVASSESISPADKQAELREQLKAKVEAQMDVYRAHPEEFAKFTAFCARFNNYSANNLRLICVQYPDASLVAPASYFKQGMPDKLGKPQTEPAYIRKGEHALRIWKPYDKTYVEMPTEEGVVIKPQAWLTKAEKAKAAAEGWKSFVRVEFTLVPVFDISQTNVPPEAYPKVFGFGGSENRNAEEQFKALKNYAENVLNCPVTIEDFGSQRATTRGYFVPSENRIAISDMLSGDGKLSTLIHEIGHAELHRDANTKTTAQKELEADMYSLMIESKLGIETTEARRVHLGDHYNRFIAEQKEGLKEGENLPLNAEMKVMDNVLYRYNEQLPLIEEYLDRQPSIDAQLAAIEQAQTVVTPQVAQPISQEHSTATKI